MDDQATADKQTKDKQALVDTYRSDAAQFEAKTPDFKAAYNYLMHSRAQELMALGYDDPQAIHQALLDDEFAVAQTAISRKQIPAEVIYNLATQRGYTKADPKGGSAADKLDAIERGQQAHKSLSNLGGSSGDVEMTAETLLKMPDG